MRESIMADGKIKGGRLTNRTVNRMMQPVKAIFTELQAEGILKPIPPPGLED